MNKKMLKNDQSKLIAGRSVKEILTRCKKTTTIHQILIKKRGQKIQ